MPHATPCSRGRQGYAALAAQGYGDNGIAHMHQGAVQYRATGALVGLPLHLSPLAEAYGNDGQPAEGLAVLDARLRGHDARDDLRCHTRKSGHPGFGIGICSVLLGSISADSLHSMPSSSGKVPAHLHRRLGGVRGRGQPTLYRK